MRYGTRGVSREKKAMRTIITALFTALLLLCISPSRARALCAKDVTGKEMCYTLDGTDLPCGPDWEGRGPCDPCWNSYCTTITGRLFDPVLAEFASGGGGGTGASEPTGGGGGTSPPQNRQQCRKSCQQKCEDDRQECLDATHQDFTTCHRDMQSIAQQMCVDGGINGYGRRVRLEVTRVCDAPDEYTPGNRRCWLEDRATSACLDSWLYHAPAQSVASAFSSGLAGSGISLGGSSSVTTNVEAVPGLIWMCAQAKLEQSSRCMAQYNCTRLCKEVCP